MDYYHNFYLRNANIIRIFFLCLILAKMFLMWILTSSCEPKNFYAILNIIEKGYNMEYDVIIIGAGNGGLTSALTLQKKGKKVLLLEKGKTPGGVATSFKRGNFEFDASLQDFYGYNGTLQDGSMWHLFERLGINQKISFKNINESLHILCPNTKEEYTFPCGIEAFTEKMEEYVPNSKNAMTSFFGLCEDIRDGFHYLENQKETLDFEDFYSKYPNFVQVAPYNVKTILEAIAMPRKAIEILSTFCYYLGSSISDLSFLHFATLVESAIKWHPSLPVLTSYEISCTLEQEIKTLGGTIKYFHEVDEIIVEENQVTGVRLGQEKYFSKHVISNLSPIKVYGNMIKEENIPKEALKLQNKRTLGYKCLCVYLGLNKSPEELGLTKYHYTILNSFDTDIEINRMNQVINGNIFATVQNNGANASSKNNTILMMKGIFFGLEFDKQVSEDNYFEYKEKIAQELIKTFEESSGISI